MTVLSPGSTIGILGGGQLGRMLAMAAAQLGYPCHIYAPQSDSVAAEVAAKFTQGDFDNIATLQQFAQSCDIITYEFENVPVAPLYAIAHSAPVRPGMRVLEIAQDRLAEKNFVRQLGGKTTDFMAARDEAELADAVKMIGNRAIAKTIRMGYDGKGQARLSGESALSDVWIACGKQPLIIEKFVDFEAEFSVILARGVDGAIVYWDSTRNVHIDGILNQSTLPPGPLIESQQADARKIAAAIADALEYVGVFTCEFFATKDGPVFNEMAPRVHNSGHWTIEGAITSQFENHIRAICGLPLGSTQATAQRAEMQNLVGGDALAWQGILGDPSAHLHLYGKGPPKPGRKMGHVTRLYR